MQTFDTLLTLDTTLVLGTLTLKKKDRKSRMRRLENPEKSTGMPSFLIYSAGVLILNCFSVFTFRLIHLIILMLLKPEKQWLIGLQ